MSTLSPCRQPYLGWRSQEQLGRATSTGTLVTTPAQRLANSSIRYNQIVSTCPGLSCQVHLLGTVCKFMVHQSNFWCRSVDINTILLCRPHSASSSRKKVTVSDYGDFYSDKRDRKSEPKQDNSALHESIKQVQCLHDMLNAMLIYKTQKMFVIPEKLNFDSLGHWCFLAAMSLS